MGAGTAKKTSSPKKKIKRIGILTGGGDCPGLNAVIRAAFKTATNTGWEIYGIYEGFAGLLSPKNAVRPLGSEDVKGILNIGGTILGTTNRGNPFSFPVKKDGKWVETDRSDEAIANLKKLGLDAVIAIGGDGSLENRQTILRQRDARDRRAQDHRQRHFGYGNHIRFRHGRFHRHRCHRQAALHRRKPPAGDGGGGHGPLCRLDRT